MSSNSKLAKVKSIIDSCVTYDQVKSCFSFVEGTFFSDIWERTKVLGYLQTKAYALRNADLAFHKSEMKRIQLTISK
jgi:hypothetical protein